MRKALATLPWVGQDSIQTIIDTREVRFDLKDKNAFNAEAVKAALKEKGFKEVTVKQAPSQ